MSRVGKNSIVLSSGVDVFLDSDKNVINIKGPKGSASFVFSYLILVTCINNEIFVKIRDDLDKKNILEAQRLWGTTRACINNIVLGVTQGFVTNLEITGVGYRASVQGKKLVLQLGYSHDVFFDVPEGVLVACPTATSIVVEGIDKQKVGQVVAQIKSFRKMDPYKGKGIKKVGEFVRRKEGKKK